jgi:tRNA(Ile)-lysidine synthase
MTGPPLSVAAVRVAVRRCLQGVRREAGPGALVLVACSGGIDSLALAAAAAFVGPRLRLRAGLVTVDHGLQAGSAERAAEVAAWAGGIGLAPVSVMSVKVAAYGGGPEAAARDARYAALRAAARDAGAAAVLLGHTRDDQAETVLLALARGAGPRGIAGMPSRRESDGVTYLRPLLDITRTQTAQACTGLAITPWSDPHNADERYARARVRRIALPTLAVTLGTDVVANLARTARLVAADNEVLDALAGEVTAAAELDGGHRLLVEVLAGQLAAIRTRVIHRWLRQRGVPGSALSTRHIEAVDALVTAWHGQGPVAVPGGLRVTRAGNALTTGG